MENPPTTRSTSPPTRDALPDRIVDALFERLASMYGARWSDLWVGAPMDKVKRVWGEELAGVSGPAIRDALGALDGPFAPSLPEFRSLCKQFRPREIANVVLLDSPRWPVGKDTFVRLRTTCARSAPSTRPTR